MLIQNGTGRHANSPDYGSLALQARLAHEVMLQKFRGILPTRMEGQIPDKPHSSEALSVDDIARALLRDLVSFEEGFNGLSEHVSQQELAKILTDVRAILAMGTEDRGRQIYADHGWGGYSGLSD